MPVRAGSHVSQAEIDKVWDAWLARQKRPQLCRKTADREKLIGSRLRLGYTADDLVLMFQWVWESEARGPRWLRGENDQGQSYLDLSNLLVESKLANRVQQALEWQAGKEEPEVRVPTLTVIANPMRLLRRSATATG